MTSKKAYLILMKAWTSRMDNKNYPDFDDISEALYVIKQDLDRLDKLEQENKKLKKAIEIIKQCSPNLVEEKSQLDDDIFTRYLFEYGENPMSSNYVLAFMRDSFITKEQFEVLKEVLCDD